MTTLLLTLALDAAVAADVACAEASHDFAEGELVLAVARHRADISGLPLFAELTLPRQFARGCPAARMTWRHYWLGVRAALRQLRRPEWLTRDVRWFCAPHVAHKWRRPGRWSARLRRAGARRHVYWRMAPREEER